MTYKDKKKAKEYWNRYYQEHHDEILEKQHEYHKRNRNKRNLKSREWRFKIRQRLKEEIGEVCAICGRKPNKRLQYHEIHFLSHDYASPKFILDHKENFIPVCNFCHRALHYVSKNWGNFQKYLQFLKTL